MPFATLSQLVPKEIFPGTFGRYAHIDQMTIGEVELAAGTVIPLHQHPNEQITFVLSGRFDFRVGDETHILESGTAALIPGNVPHGGTTLTACRVLDVFAPVRQEYRVV